MPPVFKATMDMMMSKEQVLTKRLKALEGSETSPEPETPIKVFIERLRNELMELSANIVQSKILIPEKVDPSTVSQGTQIKVELKFPDQEVDVIQVVVGSEPDARYLIETPEELPIAHLKTPLIRALFGLPVGGEGKLIQGEQTTELKVLSIGVSDLVIPEEPLSPTHPSKTVDVSMTSTQN